MYIHISFKAHMHLKEERALTHLLLRSGTLWNITWNLINLVKLYGTTSRQNYLILTELLELTKSNKALGDSLVANIGQAPDHFEQL